MLTSTSKQATLTAALGLLALASCGGPPCRAQSDCPFGAYCVLSVSASGQSSGQCTSDCLSAEDCPAPDSDASRAICDNEGRCRVEARPPRLFVLEPEVDTAFEEGTRRVRVSGEVETAAASVTITVASRTSRGCFGGLVRTAVVDNAAAGAFATLPFVVDGVLVDSGLNTLIISAAVQGSRQTSEVQVDVPCPGCAEITVEQPNQNAGAPGLELPRLTGLVHPAPRQAIWRVHSAFGDVFDGTMQVQNDRFLQDRLPLFAGTNRVEVVVTGVGEGLGEARCSTTVVSALARERGLRAVMSWDGLTSDVDLHLLGPGGMFGDPLTTLTARSQHPTFGGQVDDDADGLGPEVLTVEHLPDGAYGVVVEPIADGADAGSTVQLRLLMDGRTLTPGPIGPRHVSAQRGALWIVGALVVSGGAAQWRDVDELVPASQAPTRPPADWPLLY